MCLDVMSIYCAGDRMSSIELVGGCGRSVGSAQTLPLSDSSSWIIL